MDFDKIMARARKTNLDRDKEDRASGSPTPADMGVGEVVATAKMALEAGIRSGDWDCIAEALDLLMPVELRTPTK